MGQDTDAKYLTCSSKPSIPKRKASFSQFKYCYTTTKNKIFENTEIVAKGMAFY